MAITGENISKFTYIGFDDDSALSIQNYLSTKLIEAESKHVAFLIIRLKFYSNYQRK